MENSVYRLYFYFCEEAVTYLSNLIGWKEIVQSDGHVRNTERIELLANFRILVRKTGEIQQTDYSLNRRRCSAAFLGAVGTSCGVVVVFKQFRKEGAQLTFSKIGIATGIKDFQS